MGRSNPLKCITPQLKKLSQETMSDSMSRTSLSRTSNVVWLPQTANRILPKKLSRSLLRLSSRTIQVRSMLDTNQCWIATLLMLPANLLNSDRRLIVVVVKFWKKNPDGENWRCCHGKLDPIQANVCGVFR